VYLVQLRGGSGVALRGWRGSSVPRTARGRGGVRGNAKLEVEEQMSVVF